MKIIYIDCETTGLEPETDEIIELAAIYEEDGNEVDTFHQYSIPSIVPDSDWTKIAELTGITRRFLEEKGIAQVDLYRQFLAFLDKHIMKFDRGDKAFFSAYNAKFDNNFIRELFARNGNSYFGSYFYSACLDIISTAAMVVALKMISVPPSFKNCVIAQALEIPFEKEKLHSAIEDIRISREIQIKCAAMMMESKV